MSLSVLTRGLAQPQKKMQYDTEELHQTSLILFNTVFPQIVKMLQKMINIY